MPTRGVEPYLVSLSYGEPRLGGRALVAQYVGHRRLKVGVAETFDDDAVDARDLPAHRVCSIYTYDGSDADR